MINPLCNFLCEFIFFACSNYDGIDNLVALAAVLQVSIDDILIVQNEMYDCKGA